MVGLPLLIGLGRWDGGNDEAIYSYSVERMLEVSALILFARSFVLGFGLRGWDLRNDEAIYSYAVDRVLETGEWMTPRSSPSGAPVAAPSRIPRS